MTNPTQSLLSINQLSDQEILAICHETQHIQESPLDFSKSCAHKTLALLFFEASTRTYFSFYNAMQRLGGHVLGFSQTIGTSINKGESLEDTARMMACYADILAVRHSEKNALARMDNVVNIPVINAGEGVGEHPTQTLIDLFTIYKTFQRLNICIALYGDLKYGRTNHSLLLAAARFGAKIICVAPEALQMPLEYSEQARKMNCQLIFTDRIAPHLAHIDVIYVSRLQKERLPTELDYENLKRKFTVDLQLANQLKDSAIIMHPLPRVGEITEEVDNNPRAKYFEQAANGLFVRMAIIKKYLGA